MADPSAMPTPAHGTDSDAEFEVSLRIISPSSDLADFPVLRGLSPSTTVREVRIMVEKELHSRMISVAGMRLIYRGRMFDADHKTLQDVIGSAALKETEPHTLHLVLRDGSSSNPGIANAAAAAEPQPVPTYPAATSQPMVAGPSTGHGIHAHTQTRVFVRQSGEQNQHLLAEDYTRAAARQNSEARRMAVLEALRANRQPMFGRNEPPSASYAPQNQNPSTAVHLEQFFAAADAAARNGHDQHSSAMYTTAPILRHRNVPQTPSLAPSSTGRPANEAPPAVYILKSPDGPRALLINASGTAYYSPAAQRPAAAQVPMPAHYEQAMFPQTQQPNANDLIREHNVRHQNQHQHHINLARQHVRHMELLRGLEQEHLRDARFYQAPAQGGPPPPPAQPGHQAPGQPFADGIPNFHANIPGAAGNPVNNAGFLAAVWPQVWLIARLILFIWWFTHPTASWTRWATVILLAAAVFIVNTGMLDSLANRLWIPIRAHLDGLLQVGAPDNEANQANAAAAPASQNAGEPAAAAGQPDGAAPNPADVARRLVERRQLANGERLMNFARSLERFGILFLASLAPGIAERHVQLVEEQERRRLQQIREQLEAAAAAATATAEAAAAALAEASAEKETPEVSEEADVELDRPAVAADDLPVN